MLRNLLISFLFLSSALIGQSSFDINGYLQNMQTVWAPKDNLSWLNSGTISNRINLNWYSTDNLKFEGSLRNVFDYGQFVSLIPSYSDIATTDNGYIDLTEEVFSGKSHLFYFNIDRLNFTYTFDNLEFQIGRQRINWGINSVWTPNDIFNSSSFLNFDYAEKPGSDALRIQYYIDFASSIELVSKVNDSNNLTLAGKLQLNKWDYDFQFLAGISASDYIFGSGWSGSISDAGFSGEFTYFKDKSDHSNDASIFVTSVGLNYTFKNSLYISGEFLFNSVEKNNSTNNLFDLDYSAKRLSPSKYSIFAQASYPLTPLFNTSIATIINPSDGSLFLTPTADISLNEDVYILISGQFFMGEQLTEWGDYGQFYYLRIKWNF